MSEVSREGWRLRRPARAPLGRGPRVVVIGEGDGTRLAVDRLAAASRAEVFVSSGGTAHFKEIARDAGPAVRPSRLLAGAAPADAVLLCDLDEGQPSDRVARVKDVALWAARTCPRTVLIIASAEGPRLSHEAARASGLSPWLILSPGGLPLARAEADRLARLLLVDAAQICVPVIGVGSRDAAPSHRPLHRYTSVAGISMASLGEGKLLEPPRGGLRPERAPSSRRLAAAAVGLASAVLSDSRAVFSCGAWVEGAFGIAGGFVTVPVRVGARGAEEPLALRLTLEEKALLQRAAAC